MAKAPKEVTTIRLDADLLKELDEIAEARNESRSAVIERCVRNELPSERAWLRDMESPTMRALAQALSRSSSVVAAALYLGGEKVTDQELAERIEFLEMQMQRGRERESERKTTKRQAKQGA